MVAAGDLKKARPGPVQHPELPRALLDQARWSYRVVGHYLLPTLEQWELGFMRDQNVVGEIGFWCRVTFAFIDYHRRRDLPVRSDAEERDLTTAFAALGSGAEGLQADDLDMIRACLEQPVGFAEEAERVRGIDLNEPWEPPESVRDWPP